MFAIVVRPSEFPPSKPADQWAAEAVVIGAGALVFAVVGTVIATIAFINSTEKPSLRLEASYPGRDEPLAMSWNNSAPDESGDIISSGEYPEWWLSLRLQNYGPVAARFAAIQVTFGEGAKLQGTHDDFRPWQGPSDRFAATNDLRWEGGADAVVHPSWVYRVRQLGTTCLVLTGAQSQTSFRFTVEVVADNVPPLKHTYTIKVPRDK